MAKNHLLKWASAQNLRMREKTVLGRLAAFADPRTAETWVLVKKLAEDVGASERTIQTALRKLEAERLIERTERWHKLRNRRYVPIYRLRTQSICQEATATKPAPVTRSSLHPDGVENLHPHLNKTKKVEETSQEVSFESGAFKDALKLYPRSINTVRSSAQKAWFAASETVGEKRLLRAVVAYAEEWKKHERSFNARGLQRWLSERDYELYLPEIAAALPPLGDVPGDLYEDFAREVCPDVANKYLRYVQMGPDGRTLRPPNNFAGDALNRSGHRFFAARNLRLTRADGSER